MHTFRSRNAVAHKSGGFTLVELLVVIGIIAILAGVALGPITSGIRKARESAAMQTTRTLALAEFQYANDNNNYPDGADAGALCAELVTGNYISDAAILRISGGAAVAPAAGATLLITNVDYNFMGDDSSGTPSGPIGVPSSAPDGLPLVWSNNPNFSTIPTGTTGSAQTPAGIFGTDGMAIAYKNNNSFFRTPQTAATPTFPGKGNVLIIDNFASLTSSNGTYAIRKGANGF